MKKKGLLALCMTSIMLCVSVSSTVFAAEGEDIEVPEENIDVEEEGEEVSEESEEIPEGYVKVTDDLIVEMAKNLAIMSEGMDLDVQEIIPVYNINDYLTGYTAAYYDGDIPYGYVVFDFDLTDYIKEYAIGENIPGIYEQILNKTPENAVTTYDSELKIYTGLPMEYNIICNVAGEESAVANTGEVKEIDEFTSYAEEIEAVKPSTYGSYTSSNIFLEYSQIPHTFIEANGIGTVCSYSEDRVEEETGSFACAVSALLNICNQTGYMLNNSINDTYRALWDSTESHVDRTEDGIRYGGTDRTKVGPGMQAYLNRNFKKQISTTLTNSPSFNKIKSTVNAPRQSIFAYGINVVNHGRSAHEVVVDGYRVTNNGGQYLQVANGWWSRLTYINFGEMSFMDSGLIEFYNLPVYD